MSLHMKGAQDVQCRFIVSGAGAQKVEYARLYRKMAAILTLQVFYVKLLSLSPSFPASYGGACFKSQHFVGRGWKDQGFYASLGYTLGSRPSWNLLTLSLMCLFGGIQCWCYCLNMQRPTQAHVLRTCSYKMPSWVETDSWELSSWMCECADESYFGHYWEMVEIPEVDVKT